MSDTTLSRHQREWAPLRTPPELSNVGVYVSPQRDATTRQYMGFVACRVTCRDVSRQCRVRKLLKTRGGLKS